MARPPEPNSPEEPAERDTPVTYSRDEATRIRTLVADPDAALVCPRCGGMLEVGQPIASGGTMHPVWEIHCLACRRVVYATRVAATRRTPREPRNPE